MTLLVVAGWVTVQSLVTPQRRSTDHLGRGIWEYTDAHVCAAASTWGRGCNTKPQLVASFSEHRELMAGPASARNWAVNRKD